MFKKTISTLAVGSLLVGALAASPVDLKDFQTDFNTLMNGVAHDVAPSLRMGALAGDILGDATIDHLSVSFPAMGINTTSGLGRVLRPESGTKWNFILPLADLVNDNAGDNSFFEHLMAYPSLLQPAVGFGWNGWDVSVSGIYFPGVITDTAVSIAESDPKGTLHQLKPTFSFGNIGFGVRRSLLVDSGSLGVVPALSLGAGYHYTFFNLGVHLRSLTDLKMDAPKVDTDQTLDMTGPFEVSTGSHVMTVDLQLSKHLLIFTPYFKLSGAYQNSTFNGNVSMTATVTNNKGTPQDTSDDTYETQSIVSKPSVNVSDFGFLVTSGLEINLFVTNFNINVVGDMSRAFLKVKDFSLKGIDANAFSVNTGFRFAF